MSSIIMGYLFAIILVAVAYSGVYLNIPAKDLYIPTENECSNPTLWDDKILISHSCPLTELKSNLITYWNKENFGEERELLLFVVGKKHTVEPDDSEMLRIRMDGVIYEMDKKTHEVIKKQFIDFEEDKIGYFFSQNLTTNVEVKRIPMHPDHYYQLEIYQLAGYNCKPGDNICSDHYMKGVFLLNGMLWPGIASKDTFLMRYQMIVFSSSLISTLIFLYKLLTKDLRRLKSARTWLTLAFTAAVLSYTCPEPWIQAYFPILRDLVTFRQAYIATIFLSACIADISLVHLPPILNHIAWVAVIVINIIMVSMKYLAVKETLHFTRVDDINRYRLFAFHRYEHNYQAWGEIKIWILYFISILFYFMKFRANKKWQDMSPAVVTLALWVCCAGRGKLPFKEHELIISKLHLDLAYIPFAVFLYQYLSLSMRGDYEQLPTSDSAKNKGQTSKKVI